MGEVAALGASLVLLAGLGVLAFAAAAVDARAGGGSAGDPARQAVRLLMKRRRVTPASDTLVWRLGGVLVVIAPVLASVVTPVGGRAVADLDIGVVWWTALMAVLWVGVWLVGWGGNSAYALVGAYRFTAQALAYEMPLAMSVITVALGAGSLRVGAVVEAQRDLWFGVWMPVAFVTYLVCVLAAAFWGPFAAPTGVDLAGGTVVELSGVDRLVVAAGRYLVLAAGAGFAVPLFLGGGAGPVLPGWAWSVVKILAVLGVLVAARRWFPVVRMDRFMAASWLVLLPLTLVQLFVVGLVVLIRS